MKTLMILPLAAILSFGAATGAQAWNLPSDFQAEAESFADYVDLDSGPEVPYDRCHGRSSGTAHHTCGSRTGGPSGGLF